MIYIFISSTVFLAIVVAACIGKICHLNYKIGYYEQTLINHKDKFDKTRWEYIERKMKG